MGKLVKALMGSGALGLLPKQLMGNDKSAKRKAAAAEAQAAVQTQVANVNQQNAVNEQASASSRAMGGQTRNRRGFRLFGAADGKASLG